MFLPRLSVTDFYPPQHRILCPAKCSRNTLDISKLTAKYTRILWCILLTPIVDRILPRQTGADAWRKSPCWSA